MIYNQCFHCNSTKGPMALGHSRLLRCRECDQVIFDTEYYEGDPTDVYSIWQTATHSYQLAVNDRKNLKAHLVKVKAVLDDAP